CRCCLHDTSPSYLFTLSLHDALPILKPDREPVLAGVGLIPGIPRVDRLRLAGDQAPVDRTDVVLLEDREAPLEGAAGAARHVLGDRKSTRLNSSHGSISYAVFCLKKK